MLICHTLSMYKYYLWVNHLALLPVMSAEYAVFRHESERKRLFCSTYEEHGQTHELEMNT